MSLDPPTADAVPSIDDEPLDALESEPGGRDTLVELVGLFAADMPRRLGELRRALTARDAQRASRWAHSIKGGAVTMGAMRLAHLAEQVEHARVPIESSEASEMAMTELDAEFVRARDALLRRAAR